MMPKITDKGVAKAMELYNEAHTKAQEMDISSWEVFYALIVSYHIHVETAIKFGTTSAELKAFSKYVHNAFLNKFSDDPELWKKPTN